MDFVSICSKCGLNNDSGICVGCGSNHTPINIHQQLHKVVEMLIKMGVGVIGSDVQLYTSHNSSISIYLAAAVPEHLFNGLPSSWELQYYDLKSIGAKVYQLCCYPENDDNTYSIDNMINNLECWLKDKDPDGFKSMLRLAEYDVGI